MPENSDQAGALAEFTALRQEIDRRSGAAQALYALQVTITAAGFSFLTAGRDHGPAALTLPFVTFALATRYIDQVALSVTAGQYIRDVLSPRVTGSLGWEAWQARRRSGDILWRHRRFATLLVAFPLVSLAALAWAWEWTVNNSPGGFPMVCIVVASVAGTAVLAATVQLLWQLVYRIC